MSCVTFLLVPNGHQGVQTVLQSHDLESHVEGGQDEDTDSVGTVDSQCLCLVHPMHSFYIIALNIVLLTWLNRWGEWHVAKRAVRICHQRSLLHLPWLSLEFQIEKCYILGIHKAELTNGEKPVFCLIIVTYECLEVLIVGYYQSWQSDVACLSYSRWKNIVLPNS